jgi:uncharacterized phage-associated protein
MAFSAKSVANEFLRLAYQDVKRISPLKMQKLAYLAHGWHLAVTGRPLLNESIQAWKYGPVIPTLYREFKESGSASIVSPAAVLRNGQWVPARLEDEGTPEEVATARQVIERVWQQYGSFTASDLTTLTHTEGSPWDRTPDKEEPGTVISDASIREYFLRQAKAS